MERCLASKPVLRSFCTGITMLRRLILMRHAKSAWPEGIADHDRPLAPRGQSTAPMMGEWLKSAGLKPDLALISSARRTRETWALVAPALVGTPFREERRLFAASTETMLEIVQTCSDAVGTLMVVAHNPATQDLAHRLASRVTSDLDALARLSRHYPTAAITLLEGEGEWAMLAPGTMRLARFTTPRLLGGIDED
ncbi:SixA Phosphohistidine phosphatase SixA [Rhabdaerophilaceae bacterium]